MPPRPHPHLRVVDAQPGADPVVTIDCDYCIRRHTDECDDCVVSYLVDHDPATPVVFDQQEQMAIELLADAGLLPRSRFEPAQRVG